MIEAAVTWLTDIVVRLGYVGITLLMALESSFVPFPSEVVLPPAGYAAAQGEMSAWGAFAAGLLGSLIGALINYFLAAKLGRPFLIRYGRWVLITEAKLELADLYFKNHGEISMFVGRLIPAVRQLISLPAGVARMRMDKFLGYTALGAGIWCAVLTWIGWYLGRHATLQEFDRLVSEYKGIATVIMLLVIAAIVGVYVYVYRRRRAKSQTKNPEDPVEATESEVGQ